MSWIAGGVFTPMLHRVEDDADTMLLDRRRYWWSTCDHVCVILPPELTIDQIYSDCGSGDHTTKIRFNT